MDRTTGPDIDTTGPDIDAAFRVSAVHVRRSVKAAAARKAGGRREGIDPTTCERDYSAAELEFMGAMQGYKEKAGRMFPTWSEVLEVLQGLGYARATPLPHHTPPDERPPSVGRPWTGRSV